MDIQNFIANFAKAVELDDYDELESGTEFRDLDDWSSLAGLAVMEMIEKEYGVKITEFQIRRAQTIGELADLAEGKK